MITRMGNKNGDALGAKLEQQERSRKLPALGAELGERVRDEERPEGGGRHGNGASAVLER